jgi:hypothetical protein
MDRKSDAETHQNAKFENVGLGPLFGPGPDQTKNLVRQEKDGSENSSL